MVFDRSIRSFQGVGLVPLFPGGKWSPVNLAPNTYFARARVLGQITNAANDVQTATVTGGPTGGLVRVRAAHPMSGAIGTFDLPWNATNVVAQSAIRGLMGPTNYNVTGGPWPGTPLVFTAAGQFVSMPILLMVVSENLLTGGAAPAATFVKTTHGRSKGTFAPYVPGNADGSEVAKGLLQYECATDSAGNITFGPRAVEGYAGEVRPDAPMWVEGTFDTKEIVGLDAAAVAAMGGRIVRGSLADGDLYIAG
jgi:hypothetical protein